MSDLKRIPVSSPAAIAVFQKILTHGPIARIDVARRTGLSQAAVTKAVNPLIESGYVVEAQLDHNRRDVNPGRPVSPLVVARERANIIGVKVTADTVYAVLTDLSAFSLASTKLGNRSARLDDVLDSITAVVEELRASAQGPGIEGVGVSVSGEVDAEGGVVRDSPLMGWKSVALAELLEPLVGVPVTVDNDVRALTAAEQLFGPGVDASSFAVVTIGAGIGCGIFVNGDVIQGAHGVSGEIGHLPLAPGDLICSCGRRGCVETIASSRAIIASVQRATDTGPLTLEQVIQLAHAGDPAARAAFADAGDTIGAALAGLVNLIGPELVIIAGEGVAEYELYAERIRQTFSEHAFGSALDCDIILRSHTFDDWARGAAIAVIRKIARGESRIGMGYMAPVK